MPSPPVDYFFVYINDGKRSVVVMTENKDEAFKAAKGHMPDDAPICIRGERIWFNSGGTEKES